MVIKLKIPLEEDHLLPSQKIRQVLLLKGKSEEAVGRAQWSLNFKKTRHLIGSQVFNRQRVMSLVILKNQSSISKSDGKSPKKLAHNAQNTFSIEVVQRYRRLIDICLPQDLLKILMDHFYGVKGSSYQETAQCQRRDACCRSSL